MAVVVAIDAGTTGVRSFVIDEHAEVVCFSYREFPQYFPKPGWVEHDLAEIAHAIDMTLLEVAKQITDRGQTIAAIGITNQRETVGAWHRKSLRPFGRAIVWQDRRTAEFCDQLTVDQHLPLVRNQTGLVLDPYFSGTKINWMNANYDLPKSDVCFGTIDTWVLAHLTAGASNSTDPSNASRTMLFDIRKSHWSPELAEMLDVDLSTLPEVKPSSGRFALTADSCPLGPGIPISGIAGDQQAALFGQACFEVGAAKSTYGTGSFVLMNVGETCPPPSEGLLTTIAWQIGQEKPTYALEAAIFSTGSAVQWLRDGLKIIDSASDIEALANSVASTDGLFVVPAFTGLGSPWWDPNARGLIIGISRGSSRAHLARATLESIAFQVRDAINLMETRSQRSIVRLLADGGAAANDTLMQMQADVLGASVARPKIAETTALGAAFLAGIAEGVWASTDQVTDSWKLDREFEPTTDTTLIEIQHDQWLEAVTRSRSWID